MKKVRRQFILYPAPLEAGKWAEAARNLLEGELEEEDKEEGWHY